MSAAGAVPPAAHKANHASGGTDALTPADIGAQPAGSYAPASHGHTLDAVTDTATRVAMTPAERTKLGQQSGTNTGDQDLSKMVTTDTTQTITGAKTMTAPTLVAAVPAATFGPDLTPAGGLGDVGWTLAGGASWSSPNLTIPSGGSVSCTVSGIVSGRTYQIDVTRSASSGGDMTVSIGGASISMSSWDSSRVTVVASASGALTLTVGGGTWVATVQAIVVREVTATAGPALTYGAGQVRQAGSSNNALGYAAQYSLTTGSSNNALGYSAQYSLTTGSNNNALGHAAQYGPRGNSAWATTAASRQVSIGHESGQGSANQSDDIVTIGYRAIADGAKAMALGSTASAAHAGSVALGADVTTTALAQVAIGPRHLAMSSVTAPTAPPASGGRLFVQVTGGKSQLAVIFPTGAIQILATEP